MARRPIPTLYLAPYNPFPTCYQSDLSFPHSPGLQGFLCTCLQDLARPPLGLVPSYHLLHSPSPLLLGSTVLAPTSVSAAPFSYPPKHRSNHIFSQIANPHHHSPTIFYVIHGIAFPKHKYFLVLSSLAGFLPRMYENIHENIQAP